HPGRHRQRVIDDGEVKGHGVPPSEDSAIPPARPPRWGAVRRVLACATLIVVQFPLWSKEAALGRRTRLGGGIPVWRPRLWKAFAFGFGLGLLLAVVQRASQEFQVIRALLFE